MAVTNTPIFPQTITNTVQTFKAADTSALKTIYTGGTNGSRVENGIITNTDTNPYTIQVWITVATVPYLIATFTLAASAGNTAIAASFNLITGLSGQGLLNLDSNGNPYLYLASGSTLQLNSTTTITALKTVSAFVQGEDF